MEEIGESEIKHRLKIENNASERLEEFPLLTFSFAFFNIK